MPTLNWIGKDKVINHHLDVPYRILEKQYTHNAEASENKIIHGDNLEALKALLPEYEGRVKCIYIDPPYNTGNEGWVYNDNVNDPKIKKWLGEVVGKESEDLTRHDKWLCMMYPRLKLLHRLLADDGAIFISIDDNEQANLKLMCDEILGAKKSFPTPKPSILIQRILELSSNKDSIILDSFAGSGTTAHAVLNLNKQDGGNRKFILVEMEDYADDITAERVKRVIDGYGEGKSVEGTGGDFSYYELGQPMFTENNYLNEELPTERIREYIWYTETQTPYAKEQVEEKYLLGANNSIAYYFYYDRKNITTLDEDFLATIRTKEDGYVIYADNCVLSKSLLQRYHITFKKIPRDISRF